MFGDGSLFIVSCSMVCETCANFRGFLCFEPQDFHLIIAFQCGVIVPVCIELTGVETDVIHVDNVHISG